MTIALIAEKAKVYHNGDMTGKSEQFQALTEAIATLDRHLNKVRERDSVKEQFMASERTLTLINDFRRQLADIYRNPERSFEVFAATCITESVEDAIAKFTENPDIGGELKGWSIGPLNNSARTAILKLSLPIALKTGSSGFTAHLIAGGGSYSQSDLRDRIERLKVRMMHLSKDAGVSGDRITLELRVAEAAKKTSPLELRQLSSEHLKLVEDLMHKCKPLLIDTRSPDEIRRDEAAKAEARRKEAEARKTAQDLEVQEKKSDNKGSSDDQGGMLAAAPADTY